MGITNIHDLMSMTRREFEDLYTGYRLRSIDLKEERMELAKMTSYASNVKRQDWTMAFGDTTKMRIVALGGEADMENAQISEAKLNQKLTEMINRKKPTQMDNLEQMYLQQNRMNMGSARRDV